jgi:hypothetical protein
VAPCALVKSIYLRRVLRARTLNNAWLWTPEQSLSRIGLAERKARWWCKKWTQDNFHLDFCVGGGSVEAPPPLWSHTPQSAPAVKAHSFCDS